MAETVSLGKLLVELLYKDAGFSDGLTKAESKLSKSGQSMRAFGDTVSGYVTKAMQAASVAIAGMVAASAVVGVAFEQQITKVAVLTGDKEGGLGMLTEAARKMGAETTFSASEAAGAMESLAQAGFEVTDVIGGTEAALALAAASGGQLSTATSLVAATMTQFSMTAADSARIADVFTVALNTSQLDMEGLAVAMSYAGTVGASFGHTLEETSAAVAMFSNLGLEGQKAGTAFRMAMSQAANVTKEAEGVLAKYGMTARDINPELFDFGEILKAIGEKGMTTSDVLKVFGTEVGGNVAALAQQAVSAETKLERTFDGIVEVLNGASGKAQETATDMLDNVAGRFEQAKGSFEELLLTLFDLYKGPLTELLSAIGDVLNAVSANFKRNSDDVASYFQDTLGGLARWLTENQDRIAALIVYWTEAFLALGQQLQALIPWLDEIAVLMGAIFVAVKIVEFGGAIMTLVSTVGALSTALFGAEGALIGLTGTLSVATGGVYLLVAAVGAIITALVAYVAMTADAEAAAERLTEAQRKQRMLNDEAYQAEVANIREVLMAQQERAREELAANNGLTKVRQRELESVIALTAEQAVMKKAAGELVVVNGELRTAQQLVNQAWDEADTTNLKAGLQSIRNEAKATKEQIALYEDQLAKAQAMVDEGMSSEAAAAAAEVYGIQATTVEDLQVQLEGLRGKVSDLADAENKFKNNATLAQRAIIDEANAGADAVANAARGVADFSKSAASESEAAAKQIRSSYEQAYKARIKLEQDALEGMQDAQATEEERRQLTRDREIAELAKAYDEELALARMAGQEGIGIEEAKLQSVANLRAKYAAEDVTRAEELQKKIDEAFAPMIEGAKDAIPALEDMNKALEEMAANLSPVKVVFAAALQSVKDLGGAAGQAALGFLGQFSSMAGGILDSVTSLGGALDLVGAFQGIDNLQPGAKGEAQASKAVEEAVQTQIAFVTGFTQALPTMLQALVDSLPALFDAIITSLPLIVQALMAAVPGLIMVLKDAVIMLLIKAPDIIAALLSNIPMIIESVVRALPDIVFALIAAIPSIIGEVIAQLPALVGALLMIPFQMIQRTIELIASGQIFIAMWKGLKKLASDFGKAVVDVLTLGIGGIFRKTPNKDKKGVAGLFQDFGNLFKKNKGGAYSGVEYVPATMRMTVHQGEAVVPAHRNPAAGGGAAPAPAGFGQNFAAGGGGGGGPVELSVLVDGQVVDGALVNAASKGRAPKIQRMLRQATGTRVGFDRGRYTPWSK